MTISVLIPTYRRQDDLCRCLTALEAQTRLADEVLVVVRDTDEETRAFLAGFSHHLPLHLVTVGVPGVIAAMSEGLTEAKSDIIALTDDDTAPYPDWLERIETHFAADPHIGGVGGRDWQPIERGSQTVVGKIQWHGRTIGNHHLGIGPAREVDILKGANCAYWTKPLKRIGFETRLRGKGAQVHWELALGLAMRRDGWKLIYDPAIALDHFPAQRFDADTNLRGVFNAEGIENAVYNETLILLSYLPPVRRIVYLIWASVVGTRGEPGLAQMPRLAKLKQPNLRKRLKATQRGRMAALKTYLFPTKHGQRERTQQYKSSS